ncbi:MAG: endonuclease III [Bdellovibrio sp.]|nr:MAG: endonuclease III [Bdellovibrio sp.]
MDKKRVQQIIRRFKKYYPNPQCALVHHNPLELLVATILSAQCTDERVNEVTKTLFKKYRSAKDYAEAKLSELEKDIYSTGFYKNKARNIKACCRELVEKYHGKVPKDLESLVKLPGVGRKTANVVLGNAFGISSGIVVDTHVTRLSRRLGLVDSKNPQIIERELMKVVPKKDWIAFSHWLILHGRQICKARRPLCEKCFLEDLCPKKF